MASELLKVAYANAASNSEVKLIDGASGHTYTFYQLQFVKQLVQQKLLIFILWMMAVELTTTFINHKL